MIRSINQLKLSVEDQQKLLHDARLIKQSKNIRFRVLSVTKVSIKIEAAQDYHISEDYASAATLTELARILFHSYVPNKEIIAVSVPYSPEQNEMPTINTPYYDERMKAQTKRSKEFDQDELED